MDENNSPQQILITGASGGLGGALARYYARPGVTISLWGRDEGRLRHIARICQEAGATVSTRSIDITDIKATLVALAMEDKAQPFDLALLSSGRGDVRADNDLVEDPVMVAQLAATNFTAPAAMGAALAKSMAQRGHGKIVFIGSAAGFHALPFAAAYSGSKAGLAQFAEALRIGVKPHGVSVTLVSPGFIDTSAGRKVPGPKPMLMKPERVAAKIAQAVERGTAHLVLPWPFVVLRWFDRLLPGPLRERLLRSLSPPNRG